jgi:hypothetical protein
MKKERYKSIYNVNIKNRLNNESVTGNIVDEKSIEGKNFWVMCPSHRPNTRLLYSKDVWLLYKKA